MELQAAAAAENERNQKLVYETQLLFVAKLIGTWLCIVSLLYIIGLSIVWVKKGFAKQA